MNIQQLKYFIQIADSRNVSDAALSLFVTQPTLSLALKKMEGELNTKLFNHSDSPYQLTDTGLVLYERGQVLVQQFDQLIDDLHSMQDTSSKQVIHLGLTTLFAMQFMKEISTFLAQNPNVELIIKQGGSHELQKMLVNKEIDIGLVSFPNYQTEMINIDVLETTTRGYNVYVVVPENNPLASLEELTFKDLKGQRFSSLSDNFMIGRMLIDQSRAFGFEPNIVLYNDDLQVLIHSVVKNNSICLLPIEYRQVGKSEGVKWIPLKDKYNFFPIGIALRKDYLRTDVLDNFIGIIKEN
ncbi:LysR family transcriptional regulator [Vagococcus salmoninarum]|uniref:LysR family transcriptional regulator n=2 Tax=Vagococcus salmoninarum TaxID=2739 RepID=A0A429ZW72_9ENTE|nr:LysR family transcriptional regulator [Vagococcus salmoninarum]MBE9389333.1 LysR family transcriptional regulator [Vagococcus salmoninarum]RST97915.1 LysR family transcriptional regulator [Vagococcus salmoninarum]